ncbi:MAG TPA: hypothetical protein VJN96_11480 [Vicinamibacterales bacterium]|nr:hypothetical protein [Vicinamibacterales bacterium]
MTDSPVPGALAAAKLRAVRMALLALHKTLLDHERLRYERTHGRIETAGQALHLVMNDPWFAWLRPVSALIVQADEKLDDDRGVGASDVAAFVGQIRDLVQGSSSPEFQAALQRVLQEAPEAVMAQGRLTAALALP